MKLPRSVRLVALLATISLVAAACGDDDDSSSAAAQGEPTEATNENGSATTMRDDAAGMEMMPLPDGAENMKLAISSPAVGTKITDNVVTLQVAASGYDLDCGLAGKPEHSPAAGHYHVLVDKSLVDMYCTPEATVSMQNLKPGTHTLTVVPAFNDHAEVLDNAQSITIDWQPTSPPAEITDATTAAKPTIKITSPKAGDTVTGAFDVVVEVSNFNLSCDLYGKPGVAGYGHWHVNADSTTGPMMGMGTMFGMSCERVFHATTNGLKSGERHSIIALLVDNGHAPLMPAIEDKVEVTIG